LTSQNTKYKNDLLKKIRQVKKETSVMNNKFKIIETARIKTKIFDKRQCKSIELSSMLHIEMNQVFDGAD